MREVFFSKSVGSFTLFNMIEQDKKFLKLLNYTDVREGSFPIGDGLCENLHPYSKVWMDEQSGDVDPPSMDPNSDEYKKRIQHMKAARIQYLLSWKDE